MGIKKPRQTDEVIYYPFLLKKIKKWQRPTLPLGIAVPSALWSLTSLFGMGRGAPPCYSHQSLLVIIPDPIVSFDQSGNPISL